MMVVLEATVRTVPVASIKSLAIMAWFDPTCALIGWPRPIAFVPAVMAADGVPVTANPDEIRSRLRGEDNNHTRRGWRTDANTDGNLSVCGVGAGKQEREEQAASA
jgi:hypothetical protein